MSQLELSRLGQATEIKKLRKLTKKFSLTVLCMQETQIQKARVEGLKHTLSFDNSFVVSSDGRSCGLSIFWNNDITISYRCVYRRRRGLLGPMEINMCLRESTVK